MSRTITTKSFRFGIAALVAGWLIAVAAFATLLLLQGPTPGLVVAVSSGFAAVTGGTTSGLVALRTQRAAR